MDCKITSSNLNKARRSGMTLMEMMVATLVSTAVFAAVMSLGFYTGRSMAALMNYVDLDMRSRNALDMMSSDIRQALDLKSASASDLTFDAVDINTGATNTLQYSYNPEARTLTRTYQGQTSTLLTECSSLQFGIYQRNTTATNSTTGDFGNSSTIYVPLATTGASLCKMVQLTWTCSRKILGQAANSESVQSAQFVMRKK